MNILNSYNKVVGIYENAFNYVFHLNWLDLSVFDKFQNWEPTLQNTTTAATDVWGLAYVNNNNSMYSQRAKTYNIINLHINLVTRNNLLKYNNVASIFIA